MSKPTLAMCWGAGCGGCEVALLEIGELLVELGKAWELVFCPFLLDTKYADLRAMEDESIDLCFYDGAVRNEENAAIARLLRRKSRTMAAFGACAAVGGVPGLANQTTADELLARAYLTSESTENPGRAVPAGDATFPNGEPAGLPALLPAVVTLDQVVEVDYILPGCPPEAQQVAAVAEAMIAGELPPPGTVLGAPAQGGTVCEECALEQHGEPVREIRRPQHVRTDGVTCLLEQGVICAGIATRSGCRARCPAVNLPCRGCYGPAGAAQDQGLALMAGLASRFGADTESEAARLADAVVDPVGTFWRFGLAASKVGRRGGGS